MIADRMALAIDRVQLFEAARSARAEANLATALLQAQDEFLSIAAHELKTPMTGAKTAAQLLMQLHNTQGQVNPERLRRTVVTIDRQIDKLSRLVIQLLETARGAGWTPDPSTCADQHRAPGQ